MVAENITTRYPGLTRLLGCAIVAADRMRDLLFQYRRPIVKNALLFLSCALAGCAAVQAKPDAIQAAPRPAVVRATSPGPEWAEIVLLGVRGAEGLILTNDDAGAVVLVRAIVDPQRDLMDEINGRRQEQRLQGGRCTEVAVSDGRAAFQCSFPEHGMTGATVVLRREDRPDTIVVLRSNWPSALDDAMPAVLSRLIKSIRVE